MIAPHPDDEAIGLGGAILEHVARGDTVQTIFMTSGELGIPGTLAEDARVIREAEAVATSQVLGTLAPLFWHQPDGSLRANDFLVESMRNLCSRVDLVYVTHGDEDHVDHAAAFAIVEAAIAGMDVRPKVLLYEVWTPLRRPTVFVDITASMETKMQAISTHLSQGQRNPFGLAALSLNSYRGAMHSPRHAGYAEAFARMKGTGKLTTAIVFLTYTPSIDNPRHEYAIMCLQDLLTNLRSSEPIHLHIADDGSPPEHVATLKKVAGAFGYEATSTNAERGGYGHSYNLATQVVHGLAQYVMPVEDDWRLMRPLNLDPLAQAIEESGGLLKCIRLGYVGWSERLSGSLIQMARQTFLLFDHTCPERFIFTGHPRLESVDYERAVGQWFVGLGAGTTEMEVAGRLESRIGVGWPLDLGVNASQDYSNLFAHVGDVSIKDAELAP